MPTLVPPLALLLLGLLDPAGQADAYPAEAEVSVPALDMFIARDLRSFTTGSLAKGQAIRVLGGSRDGWLAIAAPASTLIWVEDQALGPHDRDNRPEIVVARAVLRAGAVGSRFPGPPIAALGKGSVVRLVDVPPITLGTGATATTWRAIAPPPDEIVLYIRADGVHVTQRPPAPLAETRVVFSPPATPETQANAPAGTPADDSLAAIEAAHRSAIQGPVEWWRLDPIKARYQALLKKTTDSAERQNIQEKLDVVTRQAELADSLRRFNTTLQQSRIRDTEVERFKKRRETTQRGSRRPFVAEGMIQPSSRRVDGKRVLALIGPEGTAVAYLDVPDGLDARPMMARRVGVRGEVHFNEQIHARLITVRSFQPLDGRANTARGERGDTDGQRRE